MGETVGQWIQDLVNEELELRKVIDARQNGVNWRSILLTKSVFSFWLRL